MIRLIYCQDSNGVIGDAATGKIPWYIKEDIQHFRSLTMGGVVVMGRKTWESLPKKPLFGRQNLVLSRTLDHLEGATVIRSLKEIPTKGDVWIIGGAEVYKQALQELHIDQIRRTVLDGPATMEDPVVMPPIDQQVFTLVDSMTSGICVANLHYEVWVRKDNGRS